MRTPFLASLRTLAAAVAVAALWACGGESSPPAPRILNINNSTAPASPVGLSVEINGSDFQSAPGRVEFAQGGNVAEVTPEAAGWSPTGVIAVVPSGGSGGAFTVPGVVTVAVVTSGGRSNLVDLELVTVPVFSVENVQWTTTTPLPVALRGLGAVAVPGDPDDPSSAWVVVAGGNDGDANVDAVHANSIAQDGSLGASWTATTSLPAPRAHHAMVVAHPGNSPVASGSRVVYVIGGQESAADAPGGSDAVLAASVSLEDGTVASWTAQTSLPQGLVAPAATVYNGHLYVVGGLRADGNPSAAVYSAPIRSDGALGSWTASANAYPAAVSFATTFGFGGNLYVLGGDTVASTDPNEQGSAGTKTVRRAPIRSGSVGPWVGQEEIVKQRKKHVTWTAFGQTIAAEGVYEGAPGSLELERSAIQADGSFAAWNGITSTTNQIGANVYNAAAVVSPIRPPSGGPRFLLLGGQGFAIVPPGAPSAAVYRNTAP